jgi:hypothetical protein
LSLGHGSRRSFKLESNFPPYPATELNSQDLADCLHLHEGFTDELCLGRPPSKPWGRSRPTLAQPSEASMEPPPLSDLTACH